MAVFNKGDTTTVLSSLPYQILLYFGGWFGAVYLIVEFCILVYKGLIFPYPTGNFVSEIFLLLFVLGIELIRTFLGKKGNLTERPLSVAVSVGLTAPAVIGVIYFLLWQTYVLRIELIMCGIQLSFQGSQTLLGLMAMLNFAKAPPSGFR